MGVVLQEFLIVVGLDHERVHLPQPLHDQFGHGTQIGDEAETARCRGKNKADRTDRIMRHWKRLHRNVAHGELGAGAKNSPVPMSI